MRVEDYGFRVKRVGVGIQGSGLELWVHVNIQGLGFRCLDSGFRVHGPGCGVQGLGSRVQGSGSRVQGAGFIVQGVGLSV